MKLHVIACMDGLSDTATHSRRQSRPQGQLRAARNAASATQANVAQKLGVTRQSYDDLERSEERAAITIGKLRQAAAALGCDLVYSLVPRNVLARSRARGSTPVNAPLPAQTETPNVMECQPTDDLPLSLK